MFAQNSVHFAPQPRQLACPPDQQKLPVRIEHPSLVYSLTETHTEFRDRQRRAYDAGRHAWQERRIPAYLIPFYESIVERVGANKYTWVREDTLAEAFQVDVSTIKRWLAKLVRASLIRRQRQFGTSSRTYITAYDPATILLDGEAEDTIEVGVPESPSDAEHATTQEDQTTRDTGFSSRRTDEPSFGADLRRDLKDSHLKLSGGGRNDQSHESRNRMTPAMMQLLEREGAHALESTPKLLHYPLEELHAVSTYLDTQRNIDDRPKLFAWLVLRDFGRKLLAGAHHAWQARCTPEQQGRSPAKPQTDDPRRYVSGPCRDLVQGWQEEDRILPPATLPSDHDPDHARNEQLWQQALDRLHTMLPADALSWFAETELLELTDERAVIGTPTCIERDKLRAEYQAAIRQALKLVTMQALPVQIEIGRSGSTSSPMRPAALAVTDTIPRGRETTPRVDLWQRVLDELRRAVTDAEFQTWFAEACLLDLEDDQAIVGTPHIFAREALEGRYAKQLREALIASLGQPVTVQVVISSSQSRP